MSCCFLFLLYLHFQTNSICFVSAFECCGRKRIFDPLAPGPVLIKLPNAWRARPNRFDPLARSIDYVYIILGPLG
jgi:hypothetical protein